ncbi:PilZ domain-containing protein [Candidatus Omnitrophota bacterium]
MEEKRRFVRIEWPVLVQYKTLEDPATEDQIVAKVISEGGVSFTVYEKLTKGTKLDMQIQVPFDSMPMFIKAKVVWIKKATEELGKAFEIGVEFLEVDPRDKKRLKLYINNEIQARKKP